MYRFFFAKHLETLTRNSWLYAAAKASGKWEWDLKYGIKLHMKCTRTSLGYSVSLGDVCTTRPGTLGTTTPSPRRWSTREMRRPSLLQEVELGLSVCLGRTPIPFNPTMHQKTAQKAEKQLCECRENCWLMPTQYNTYHQWGWIPEIQSIDHFCLACGIKNQMKSLTQSPPTALGQILNNNHISSAKL